MGESPFVRARFGFYDVISASLIYPKGEDKREQNLKRWNGVVQIPHEPLLLSSWTKNWYVAYILFYCWEWIYLLPINLFVLLPIMYYGAYASWRNSSMEFRPFFSFYYYLHRSSVYRPRNEEHFLIVSRRLRIVLSYRIDRNGQVVCPMQLNVDINFHIYP